MASSSQESVTIKFGDAEIRIERDLGAVAAAHQPVSQLETNQAYLAAAARSAEVAKAVKQDKAAETVGELVQIRRVDEERFCDPGAPCCYKLEGDFGTLQVAAVSLEGYLGAKDKNPPKVYVVTTHPTPRFCGIWIGSRQKWEALQQTFPGSGKFFRSGVMAKQFPNLDKALEHYENKTKPKKSNPHPKPMIWTVRELP